MATGEPGWRQLISYHLPAVQRESVPEPVRVTDRDAWNVLHLTREDIITGRTDTIPVQPQLRTLLAAAKPDEAVYYGWPLLVMTDRSRRLRTAPLFMTVLDPSSADEQAVTVASDDTPDVNPGLLTDRLFPADALAAAYACLPDELPFGDVPGFGSGGSPVGPIPARRRTEPAPHPKVRRSRQRSRALRLPPVVERKGGRHARVPVRASGMR